MLNLSKCRIGERSVKFLGHIVSREDCKPDPFNLKAVDDMKHPKKVKEIHTFLGMCGFYRKHIPNFAQTGKPLTELTRKDNKFI